jgi:hypothetical protein
VTARISPVTIFNDLYGRARDAVLRGDVSEFELRALLRDAETKLQRVDAPGANEVRFAVAIARGDLRLADDLFAKALALTESRVGTTLRYIDALTLAAECEKARQVMDAAWGLLRNDPSAVRNCAQFMVGNGWMLRVAEMNEDLTRMGEAPMHLPAPLPPRELEEQFMAPIAFARRFLRARHAFVKLVTFNAIPYETSDVGWLWAAVVESDPEVAADLEWDLHAALVDGGFEVFDSGQLAIAVEAAG